MVHLKIKIKPTVLEQYDLQTQKQLLKISTRGQCNSMWKRDMKIPLERGAGLFFLLKAKLSHFAL